ncbi:hypothetical protein KSF78_0008541 [Schistosoma japonicum]|nr:hypothetical protein KSF78_0008541 [Schistosoma japonicum]KAH8857407.1 hypothetical protein KSF78_0008541 [Schistosoma japonicum]
MLACSLPIKIHTSITTKTTINKRMNITNTTKTDGEDDSHLAKKEGPVEDYEIHFGEVTPA